MSDPSQLTLESYVDINQVIKLQQQILALTAQGGSIVISANQVQRIDTAGLQLLTALAVAVQQQQGELVWQSPSDPLITAAKQLGLCQLLRL